MMERVGIGDIGIDADRKGLVHDFHEVSVEHKKMFARERETLGTCPNCGGQVVKGKYGVYCINKCGMNVSRVMGTAFTDAQVKDMLAPQKSFFV